MRQKAIPRPIDLENYAPSQQLYTQPISQDQQQYSDGLPNSQATSTPLGPRQSQAHLYNDFDNFSPIPRHESGFEVDENESLSSHQYPNHLPLAIQSNNGSFYNRRNQSIGSATVISGGVDRFSSYQNRVRGRKGMNRKKGYVQRRKPGTVAMREIRQLQRTTNNLLKLAPFSRVVKEILAAVAPNSVYRIQTEAIRALMDACEAYLLNLFESSYLCSNHAKRVTLMASDVQLVRRILSIWGLQGI